MPPAEEIVDRCIECGYCETMCPSHGLTLSPRQRIVSWRELSRCAAAGEDAADLEADFVYNSLDTCAGCGLCSTACPVDINTGDLTRLLRGRKLGAASLRIGEWTVGNFGKVATAARAGLAIGHAAAAVVGDAALARISRGAWKRGMPRAGTLPAEYKGAGDPVVYFPACGGRIFGANSLDEASLAESSSSFWSAPVTRRACPKAWTSSVVARCWKAKEWPMQPTRWPTTPPRHC